MSHRNTIRLYGCGGCGINLAKPYLFGHASEELDNEKLYADIEVTLLDTSYANINTNNSDLVDRHFAIINDGTEGSGSLRSENLQAIRANIKDILNTHEPADMNIIVYSTSGGSGNVIGAVLARELAQSNKPFVSIAVADSSNQIRIKNTLDALTTLDNFAKATNVPFVTSIVGNDNRGQADSEVHRVISHLALLFSNLNLELDNADTANFLNYTRVTQSPARLVGLEITRVANERDIDTLDQLALSVAMLHSDGEAETNLKGKMKVAYVAEGFLNQPTAQGTDIVAHSTMVYTIGRKDIDELISYFDGQMGEYKKATQASNALQAGQVKMTNHQSQVDDDGFAI